MDLPVCDITHVVDETQHYGAPALGLSELDVL